MNSTSVISHISNGVEVRASKRISTSLTSILIAGGLVVGGFIYPKLVDYFKDKPSDSKITTTTSKVINYSQLSAPPPIDIEQPEPQVMKAPPKVKQVKFVQPVAKKDEEVEDEQYVPTMDELDEVQIGASDANGADSILVDVSESVEAPPEVEEETFTFVEVMPRFKGGDDELLQFLGDNLKYPKMAKDVNIQGVVYVQFVVERDGRISNVTVLRGVFPALDEEAVRVIKSMPDWEPGQQNGKSVGVYFTIPIRFNLK